MGDNQILVVHSREVQFYGYDFGGIVVYHISVVMHSFQKLVSDLDRFLHLNMCIKRPSLG